MSGWQPQEPQDYDPGWQAPGTPPQWGQQSLPSSRPADQQPGSQPARYEQPQQQPVAQAVRKTALTAAESFWYVLGCIAFGAMYFAKIPAKKALYDFGMTGLTSAERFWYVLMCIPFGAGYFAKIPTAKALSELPQFRTATVQQLEYPSTAKGRPSSRPPGQPR